MAWATAAALAGTALGVPGGSPRGAAAPPAAARCPLTPSDAGDPFYKPNAPVRSSVGTGFVLTGVVRSGIDCAPVPGARVEFWLRGPDGRYDDAHRGTVVADASGRYRLQSNFPGGTDFQPHIHLRVAVPGFRPLVAVYLPRAGSGAGALDLILEPEL
jgi:protocatechuate 3,4-dioxygenase beta subunit